MISLDQEKHLGYKAFFLLALRRVISGIILLFLVLVILIFSHYLVTALASVITNSGFSKNDASATASMILMYTTIIIFWLGVLSCFLGILIAYLEYINHTFTFKEFDIIMKSGILNKKETSIPYRQIQDVNTNRSVIYQIMGLTKLVLKTSGSEEKNEHGMTEINIEPIDKDVANEIQSLLEKKIGIQIIENKIKA